MSWLFLDETLEPEQFALGALVGVSGAEAKHAVTVTRLRVGERVSVGNGRGVLATGPVETAAAERLEIRVEDVVHEHPSTPALWLAQGLAKGDRDELAVQAATELDVAGVIPWQARRSISRWEGPKAEKARLRWAQIVREASKQAIRASVPAVHAVHSTAQLAALGAEEGTLLLVLDPTAEHSIADTDLAPMRAAERVILVVGPEGGIDPAELERFAAAGAVGVRLGPSILRTSTAGPVALAVLSARLGRWAPA